MIDVTLIGTGGMLPLPDRWLTSMWLEYNGKACLVDCGEGTQIALNKQRLKLSKLDIILITHVHADHISGIPGLLLSLGNCGKTDTLKIYGHKGILNTIRQLMCICPLLPFNVEICELQSDRGDDFVWNDINVSSLPLCHGVDCLGYSFVLNRKPIFAPEKARLLGVDVKLWRELHAGKSVSVSGNTITPEMVTYGTRPPIKVTYMTDSRYFDGMISFAQNSDLLICEGMYGDDEYIEKMREKGHMVFSQSAKLAKASDSKALWLTHYSPALTRPSDYTESVRSIFSNTTVSSDGEYVKLR